MTAAAPTTRAWPRTPGQRRLLGALTVWPLLYMVLFMGSFFLFFFLDFALFGVSALAGAASDASAGDAAPQMGALDTALFLVPFLLFPLLFVAHLFTMVLIIGLKVFFCKHAFQNPALKGDDRILIFLGLLFLGVVGGFTWYWRCYLRAPQGPVAVASEAAPA